MNVTGTCLRWQYMCKCTIINVLFIPFTTRSSSHQQRKSSYFLSGPYFMDNRQRWRRRRSADEIQTCGHNGVIYFKYIDVLVVVLVVTVLNYFFISRLSSLLSSTPIPASVGINTQPVTGITPIDLNFLAVNSASRQFRLTWPTDFCVLAAVTVALRSFFPPTLLNHPNQYPSPLWRRFIRS